MISVSNAFLLVILSLSFVSIRGEDVQLNWEVKYIDTNPDQLAERKVVGINGIWPPSAVYSHQGDVLYLNVVNNLDLPLTVHNHGFSFPNSTFYDGAMMISQCGIPPKSSFKYRIPIVDDIGTYWIHAHSNGQTIDGLRTPHIILPKRGAEHDKRYDEDYVVALTEWYHTEHGPLNAQFLSIYNPTGAEPVPNSGLIYLYNNTQKLPGFNRDAKLRVEPLKRYRLRVMNMGVFAMFNFWIEGHNMTIIEVDGTDVEPTPAKTLQLSVGQRMSVVIESRSSSDFNFIMHANMDTGMFDVIPSGLISNITAEVVYSDASPFYVPTPQDNFMDVSEYPVVDDATLVPLVALPTLQNPTVKIPLNVWLGVMDDGINHGQFNNQTFLMPKIPTFLTVASMGNYSSDPIIYGFNGRAHILQGGEVVEITIMNWDFNSHPFHLHGHKVQIVSRSQTSQVIPPSNDLKNPVRRDVVMVPSGGNVVLRFKADNPGTWLLHCHINWHLKSGLAIQIIENPIAQQAFEIPSQLLEQCKAQGIPTKGNAAGNYNDPYDLTGESGPVAQIIVGWTPKAITALFLSCLSGTIGVLTVMWYSWQLTKLHEYQKGIN
eukprot:TRINITY_DN1679_c0_g1_i2.p1 TRINITY_DN1679_c0_g1~~TRINITY_DN1679_c0_g1_i2.p1  ORF type:complete len:601 (-),score=176.54 TRINITY_DN1679_c0_g1_i2:31-1833(-)